MTSTVDRDGLVTVQTPQAFAAAALREAHQGGGQATDDAGLVEQLGLPVRTVPGDPRNLKLTRPEDLELAEALMAGATVMSGGRPDPGVRIGQGLDVHRFSDRSDRPLVLGGVTVTGDGARGLEGHSDADAVAHAIADAVLGAAGLGDLGRHAPDTDPAWRDADSMELLARMVALAAAAGWVPVNADCTVVAERPKLAPSWTGWPAVGLRPGRAGQREGHPGRGARRPGPGRGDRLHRRGAVGRLAGGRRGRGVPVSPAKPPGGRGKPARSGSGRGRASGNSSRGTGAKGTTSRGAATRSGATRTGGRPPTEPRSRGVSAPDRAGRRPGGGPPSRP